MTIRAGLTHTTRYTFDHPVTVFPHVVRLRPAAHTRTRIEAYSLAVEPSHHTLAWRLDPFGNRVAHVVVPEPTAELAFTVRIVADLAATGPSDVFADEGPQVRFDRPHAWRDEFEVYLRPVTEPDADPSAPARSGPRVRAWIAGHGFGRAAGPEPGGSPPRLVDSLARITQAVHRCVAHTVRMDLGVLSPDQTLERRLGSCRDSAWLLVAILRELGLAARFASGYFVRLSADETARGAVGACAEDFIDLHAWAEVLVPGAGWIGLDPTSGLLTGEGHIPLACSPTPAAAAAIEGDTEPVGVHFSFATAVTRLGEIPDPVADHPHREGPRSGA